MPRRQKRTQQHLRQEPSRRKARPQPDAIHYAKPKPGFPMNLLTDVRYFSVVGLVVVAAMVFAAILTQARGGSHGADVGHTATAAVSTEDPNATATEAAAPTEAPLSFTAAETVIDAEASDYTATIKTARGDIVIALFADQAPDTVNSFVFLARQGYFDGITFHRVVPNFVAQTGDPSGTGGGGPGYETEQEATDLTNTRGTVAMARAAGTTKFGSQFFINLKDNPALDVSQTNQARFYPFGEVVEGMDVVDQIVQGDVILAVTVEETPKES